MKFDCQMNPKQTLHKSLTAHRPLYVSVANELPQNSTRESSQFVAEQKANGLFYKINENDKRYFQSLIVSGNKLTQENILIQESTVSQTHQQYFKAIQASLLLQNGNLKSHNIFLTTQIRRMFAKEKQYKREVQSLYNENKHLKHTIKQLQICLKYCHQKVNQLRNQLQMQTKKHCFQKYHVQAQDFQPNQPYNISQSIQNVITIFSKSFGANLQKTDFFQQNPEKDYIAVKQKRTQPLNAYYSPRGVKHMGKYDNNSKNKEVKTVNHFQENRQASKLRYFRKQTANS